MLSKYRKLRCKGADTGSDLRGVVAFSELITDIFPVIPVSHFCLSLPALFFPFILFFHSLPCEYSHFEVCDAKPFWSTAKKELARKKKQTQKPQQTPNKQINKELPK